MLKNLASMSSLNLYRAAIQFSISTLIALFVTPGEYGLITFSLPIMQFIALFTDMGLSSGIVRQHELPPEEAGAALTFSWIVGVIAAVGLFLAAYPIALYSRLDGLGGVLAAFSVSVLFSVAASVPRALMERKLRYQRIAVIEGGATTIAALACVIFVMLGAGIWAIVGFNVLLQLLRAASFSWEARPMVHINTHWRRIRGLLRFSGWVLATNIINFLGRNAQNLLIGTFLGATAVGLYGLAYQFMLLPLMAIAWPASGVLLATLSNLAVQHRDNETFARPFLGVSMLTALLVLPAMGWLTFGLAFPVHKLMSPHWQHVIPLAETLAPLAALQALAAYAGPVLLSRGHARMQFYLNVVTSAGLLAGFVVSLPYGLMDFARVYLIVGSVLAIGQIGLSLHYAPIGLGRYLQAIAPALAGTAAAMAVASLIGLRPESWVEWTILTAAYGFTTLIVYALWSKRIAGALHGLMKRPSYA